MLIYFSLFIPLLFLSTDSSSIRDRSNKNELVPFLSSRIDPLKRDSNSLKIVSNEPFIIQLQMPNPREKESKRALEKDKKRKRPLKKRVSKIKPLIKKRRTRRELLTPKTKIREEKSNHSEMPHTVNVTEQQLTNLTKNSVNRAEILKALSPYSKKVEIKQSKSEEIKNMEKVKDNASSRNLHNRDFSLSDRNPHVKMIYPSTPKPDQHQHKYTYKDLMADRERLEQKLKYIKNMLNVSDSAVGDIVRVRRRSDSDKTANKIAKMFLTLSAVNGLHDRRKSKFREDDEEEDCVRDVWEKERRNNPTRKSSSSNEERYKVKKWIEFMKKKRSSGKTCPCMANEYDEEKDVFPLEQKLPKGYFLKGRNSEESSESFSDPFYYSREQFSNNNLKNRFEKYQEQENKLKALAKNGKKKLELPFDDLEVYRSRAKQILQNAEEILDRIKEEEEKRLQSPNILMSQLKELTSRIQTDPRNNENDLIRKIQKNLGWNVLDRSNKETDDNTFIDNVKSFILDPYEKAKALTDESTKKLSSYLLRNLGGLQESSEEQEQGNQEAARENSQIYFEQIPTKEEEIPVSASLAKENPQTKGNPKEEEDTLFVNLNGDDEVSNKSNQEEIFKQRVEDIIKEQQKKVNEYKVKQYSEENSQEMDSFDQRQEKVAKTEKSESKSLGSERMAININEKGENEGKTEKFKNADSTKKTEIEEMTKSSEDLEPENSDFTEKKKKLKTDETSQKKNDQIDVTTAKSVPTEEGFEKEVKETMKKNDEKGNNDKLDLVFGKQDVINTDERERGENEESEEEQNYKKEYEKAEIDAQETSSGKNTDLETPNQKRREENVLLSPHYSLSDYDNEDFETFPEANENLKDTAKEVSEETLDETKPSKETILRKQEKAEIKTNEEDPVKTIAGENNFMQDNFKEHPDSPQYGKDNVNFKELFNEAPVKNQEESLQANEKQDPSNAKITQTSMQNNDLVKESIHDSKKFFKSNLSTNDKNSLKTDEESKEEQEEQTEKHEDQNLTVENPDDETNQASKEREKKTENDGTQNFEKLEKKLDENGSKSALVEREDRENLNKSDMDITLRMTLEKNLNEELGESEKAIQESRENFDEASEDDNNQLQAAKLENQENEAAEKSINGERFLKEGLENRKQYENDNEDTALEATKSIEEMSNESLDKSKNENDNAETLFEKENKNNGETESSEIPLRAAKNKQSDEKDLDAEDVEETTLKETISKEDNDIEVNEKLRNSNEEDSSETFLKSLPKEDNNLKDSLEETNSNQNVQENTDGETEKSVKEIGDKIFPKDLQKDNEGEKQISLKSEKLIDNFKSQEENGKDDSYETTSRVALNEKELGNLNETNDETISMIDLKDKEADGLNENEEKSLMKPQPENWNENQNQESLLSSQEQNALKEEQSKEIILKEAKPDQKNQENQSSEISGEKDDERTLKAFLNKQSQENSEVNDFHNEELDKDRKLKESSDETLKEVSAKESQDNLNESQDNETVNPEAPEKESEQNLKNVDSDEIYLKSTLNDKDRKSIEETDDEEFIKETNSKESEQRKGNFSNEASEEKVRSNEEEATEINNDKVERELNENKSNQDEENFFGEKNEEADDEGTPLRAANTSEDENNETHGDYRNSSENDRELSLESFSESQRQEKGMDYDETLKAENTEENQEKEVSSSQVDGTLSKTTSSEYKLYDKIENEETPSKSAKVGKKQNGTEYIKNMRKDESEETSREENISDDFNNQINQENENENLIKSKHFDEIIEKEPRKSLREESYETLPAGRSSIENQSAEDDYEPHLKASTLTNPPNSPDSQEEENHPFVSDLIQKTDPAKTHGKLKVPKSIGKIMKALEGKEKDDITSFRNLNPDKIDDIIDKIDEAEQQNLRQSQEIDCRKECACADEIDTKSRNMGRYEIVKDFLFWMKDLQLNRVLSDD